MTFKVPETYRIRKGPMASSLAADGLNGAFFIPLPRARTTLKVIASDGTHGVGDERWEHVSVSTPARCPTWEEMCFVKSLFWDHEDCVMQLHPPAADWISNHRYCLHLWRPLDQTIPRPASILVGYKDLGELK